MSLVRCPACHKQISHTFTFCPGCGKPKPKSGWANPKKALLDIAIGIFALMILANLYLTILAP